MSKMNTDSLTLGELTRRNAKSWPERVAYVDEARSVTWSQFHERTDALAHSLKESGISSGDRVGIVSPDCVEMAEHAVACAKLGAVRVGINYRLAVREIAQLIDDAELAVLFVHHSQVALAKEAKTLSKGDVRLLCIGQADGCDLFYEDLVVAGLGKAFEATPNETLMICYTTGSTGLPKGAIYPHEKFVRSMFYIALAEGANHDDVWLHAMPASGVPIMHMLRNMFHASKCAILGEWEAKKALKLIEQESCSIMVLVPTMIIDLVGSGIVRDYDVSSVRQLEYGAAPIPPAIIREAMKAFSCDFLQMYGSTELMGMSMMLYPSDHEKGLTTDNSILASAGRPLSYVDTRIVDDEGNEVPQGEVGELLVKTEFIIPAYHNAPDQYAEMIEGGWLRTGDMAKTDQYGNIHLGDRAKFRIKTGGYNVIPTEVENIIAEFPSVLEVAVVGIPDEKWGERVEAVVTLRDGSELIVDELKQFCRGQIADFKIPKDIHVWSDLPKGPTGKIQKREIIERVGVSS